MDSIIKEIIAKHRSDLKNLSEKIHSHPEQGFEETKAASWQVELLKDWGFEVETPVAGLSTAFKAVWGKGGPAVSFISEYDALPVTGHGCGHNLIAVSGLTSGLIMKAVLEKKGISGTVVIMGTPGEEGKGGKVIMVEKGAFDGIDAALEAHPFYRTLMDPGSLSASRFEVDFFGYSSHAAVNPEAGKNALDAVMLLFQGVNAWRQHMPESTRVHGIITEGGAAPNIIPDYAGAVFYLRTLDIKLLPMMVERFENIVKGAALMSETRYELHELDPPYAPGLANNCLNDEFFKIAKEMGLEPNPPKRGGRVSTDFGNVSQIIPGIHVYFGITDSQVPLHSLEFKEAAGTDYAFEQAMLISEVLAKVAFRFYSDKGFRDRVREDFKKNRS